MELLRRGSTPKVVFLRCGLPLLWDGCKVSASSGPAASDAVQLAQGGLPSRSSRGRKGELAVLSGGGLSLGEAPGETLAPSRRLGHSFLS